MKTTKEIYLKAFMLLQKDKSNPELKQKWFSVDEIRNTILEIAIIKKEDSFILSEDAYAEIMKRLNLVEELIS